MWRKKGSFVNIPKGRIVHGFKNLSNEPAKFLCTVTLAGLDDLFGEIVVYLQTAWSNTESETKENCIPSLKNTGRECSLLII